MSDNKIVFIPHAWHACTDHEWRNCSKAANCYSYALNKPGYYWSIPGLGFLKTKPEKLFNSFNRYFKGSSVTEYRRKMIEGAISDGLIPLDEPVDKEGYYLTALFFSNDRNNYDFDWYRKDDTGYWSHKDGWASPVNTDSRGEFITDPRNNGDQRYPVFGGFFLAPRRGIKITKKFL